MKGFMRILLTVSCVSLIYSKRHCNDKEIFLRYFKIKNCYKSSLSVTVRLNVEDIKDCIKSARERNALAFNFSPEEGNSYLRNGWRNCEILGCSEIGNSTTLVPDMAFDYYSAYGNWNCEYDLCEFYINYSFIKLGDEGTENQSIKIRNLNIP